MYQPIETPANVVAFKVSGTVTKDDILAAEETIDAKLATGKPFGFVVDLSGIEDVETSALAEDVRYETSLLGKLDQFPKVAILTDKNWMGAITKFMNPLIPSVEMKAFASDQLEDAIVFASVLPTPSGHSGPAIVALDSDRADLVAYEFDGKISREETMPVVEKMRKAMAENDKIDLLIRINHFGGFEASLLADKDLLAMKMEAMKKVRKYALVGAPAWMRAFISTVGPHFTMEVKHFETEAAAREWLAS